MNFTVDYSLSHENFFSMTTPSGNKYSLKLEETAHNSGLYILNFLLVQGVPNQREVFKTLHTMRDVLKEHCAKNNINSIFAYIDGKTREEIDKKTRVFCKLADYPYECIVDTLPEIRIQGMRGAYYPDTNFLHIKRSNNVDINQSKKMSNMNVIKQSNIKFCFECGLENKGYKFCPGCGTNLQQA